MRRGLCWSGLLVLLVTACATSGGGSGEPRRNRNVLTAEEMAPLESFTAWEAIQRLRPMWMRPGGVRNSANPRGHYPYIFVDQAPYGPLEALRNFRVHEIEELRYVNPTDSTIRYGGQYQGGIILVTIKGTPRGHPGGS